ncbi:AMP-binding protein, partial [Pedobacter jeongneungensis]|uniref:AMP-binding protein n=1 Tax=Pedobacter jeongneungensis TaxID=947309 RepID=UPI0031E74D48
VTAGEAAVAADAILFSRYGRYYNAYGPTEGSICASVFQFKDSQGTDFRNIPIGKPISNTRIYIRDGGGGLCPVGVAGEICLGGSGLARGYLNQPELSLEKFVPNPFEAGERMYLTGDLGRWLPDGNIEFLGRNDDQVKIRGYRIELGEIESALQGHSDVNRSVVVSKKDIYGNDYLVAYLEKRKYVKLTPSLSEYFVYDALLYNALTTDEKRNNHYKQVFNKLLNDKTVLDLGTGSDAILSQFCVAAGAKKVYSVEIFEEAYEKAKKKIKELGLENRITLIHGDITEIELPEKVDYCVSEIVGSIGGSEGAAKLINSTRRLLKNPANMIPKRSLTKIAAVYLPDKLHQYVFDEISEHYLQEVFGQIGHKFDLRLCIDGLPMENVITNHQPFEDLDFTGDINLEDNHLVRFEFTKGSIVNGFIVWLTLYIDEHEVIDTLSGQYVWLPVYMPVFYDDTEVEAGDYIEANIKRKLSDNDLNPDFIISGQLFRKKHDPLEFSFQSSNHEEKYCATPFYQKLFENEQLRVKEDFSVNHLIDYLKTILPDYMLPSHYVAIDELPLNSNGKIDRTRLPEPDGLELSVGN